MSNRRNSGALSVYSGELWARKCVEPVKRNKDGVQWIVHRFPIKGGISIREAMLYDMANQRNHFLDLVRII